MPPTKWNFVHCRKQAMYAVLSMATSQQLLRLFVALIVLSVLGMLCISYWKEVTTPKVSLVRSYQHQSTSNYLENAAPAYGFIVNNLDKVQTVFKQMDFQLSEKKRSIISFLSQPIINNHSFEYFLNPQSTCFKSPTEILIEVPSAPENFEKRENIRNHYGKFVKDEENRSKLLFFIGMTKDNTTQSLIDQESNKYHDIVQESFEDIYLNIRYKAVSMLKWATTFCHDVKYVIRNDDDISTNMESVVGAVKRTAVGYPHFIMGRLRFNDRPSRKKDKLKVYLSYREYPETFFPPYALGGLLGYPILTVELLYEAALREKPIWLDDVYITGICGQKIGVKLLSDPVFHFKHKPAIEPL